MASEDLTQRTKRLALGVIQLAEALPRNTVGRIVQGQLVRAGTSVGANYRAAKRAKSRADFVSKMGTVEEETDEVLYWIELIAESGFLDDDRLAALRKEANEILAMVVASIRTAKRGSADD